MKILLSILYIVMSSPDDKPNPFYKTQLPYPILGLRSMRGQRNNPLEEFAWDNPANPDDHLFYSYTYRLDGYPLSVKIKNALQTSNEWKGVLYYTQ